MQLQENSAIKAIAAVKSIRVLSVTNQSTFKKASLFWKNHLNLISLEGLQAHSIYLVKQPIIRVV
tara:strand:- start:2705 stop:2899 length:195 start_codon:yes stop_codon:yes gene_type:complete